MRTRTLPIALAATIAAACATTRLQHVHTSPQGAEYHVDEAVKAVWTEALARAVDAELDTCLRWWGERFPAQRPTLAQFWDIITFDVWMFPSKEAARAAGYNNAGELLSLSKARLIILAGEDPTSRIARLSCHELGHSALYLGPAIHHELMGFMKYGY